MEKYGRATQARDDNIIRRMRFACRISKARIQTHIHSEYLIFTQQQWLGEHARNITLFVQLPVLLQLLVTVPAGCYFQK